ncbi:hypothetical protein CVT25_004626 [Psilocybe cyanescens]|uniref:Nephrocystin 3-like N-terminal domain-containing protein n=1 Tax=Psilocybe cyanescens TaxID=93625 RepID=A0A409X296_PSICY|nr:hypothetical protein CVT25_004626 [Psilocybe cyanescens]
MSSSSTSSQHQSISAMLVANAAPIIVNDGTFTMITETSSHESALDMLRKHTSMRSTDKSEAIPRCHPNTRQSIILKLAERAQNPDGSRVLWIFGPEGMGKTSIASSFADFMHTEDHCLVASYFIGKREGNKNEVAYSDSKFLIPTIAFQLANAVPDLMRHILFSIERGYPTIFEQPIEMQLRKLIVEPVLSSSLEFQSIVVLDGLDQCGNKAAISHLLDAFPDVLSVVSGRLRFILLSRPEHTIEASFDVPALKSISTVINLKDEVDDAEDIRTFMTDSIQQLKLIVQHSTGLESSWPQDTHALVDAMMCSKLVHNFSAAQRMIHSLNVIYSIQIMVHSILANAELCALLAQQHSFQAAVPLSLELVERTPRLQQRLVDPSSARNNANRRARIARDRLLRARRQPDAGLVVVGRASDDGSVVARRAGERTAVAGLLLDVADDGSLGALRDGDHVADGQGGLFAAVDECAGVEAFDGDEDLAALLVALGVAEDDAGEGGTTVVVK